MRGSQYFVFRAIAIALPVIFASISYVAFAQLSVTTNPPATVTPVSANLNGEVTSITESATAHFDWGSTNAYGNMTADVTVSQSTMPLPIIFTVNGLIPNTTYHYRAVATNSSGTQAGGDVSFTTLTAQPSVTTSVAQNITATSVRLAATVNTNNSATTAHFDWGTTLSYGNATPTSSLPANTTTDPLIFDLGGLTPNTTYHYRVSATNSAGTSNGSDQVFSTPTLAPQPSVITSPVQDLAATHAKLNGTVNPNGTKVTTYFEWGPTTSYGNVTPSSVLAGGSTPVNLFYSIEGLSPLQTYHYRLVASNIGGTVNGVDQVFVTLQPTPSSVPVLTLYGSAILALLMFVSVIVLKRKSKQRRL
jgi:phosphodiesterase/alkaline phosphatase D-like protein